MALLAAAAWALLQGILELTVGLLVVAVVGGWSIGTALRPVDHARVAATALAGLAWLAGLVGVWLISMALIEASSRTLLERLQATPFIEWQAPLFGLVEIVGLVLYVGAAAYGSWPRVTDP